MQTCAVDEVETVEQMEVKSSTFQERQELRRDRRIPVMVQGTDSSNSFFAELVLTENVSHSGVCLELESHVAEGQRLKIHFQNGQYQAIASVKWTREVNGKARVGLKFEHTVKNWNRD